MATVKTQGSGDNIKVITKNDKVSCSCCFTECCMYPAAAVTSGAITFEDLPDEIVNRQNDFIISKAEAPIFVSDEIGTITIYYGSAGEGYGIDAENPNVWSYKIDFVISPFDACLFDEETTLFKDNFEDAYTIFDPALVFPDLGLDGTQQANRASLCFWAGDGYDNVQESNRNIFYNGNGSNGYPFPELPPDVWLIQLGEGGTFSLKTGPDQSSPVGDYEGGITVYE